MSKIIAAISISLPEVEHAKGANHLASISSDQEKAERLIASLTASKGGRFLGLLDGKFMAEMDIEAGPVLKEIKRRIQQELGLKATIGVGEEAPEADKALKHALKECPGTIKIFEPEMDMQNPVDAEPSEPSVAVSEDTSVNKSEDLIKSIDAASRHQILETLASIKQNAQLFDELKQSQPDVYAGIVSVVQSLAEMLKQAKIDDAEQTQKLVDVINKQIGKKSEQQEKKEGKSVDKELMAEQQRRADEHSQNISQVSARASAARKLDRQRSREFAAKTGHHDPEFLARLVRAFKG